MSTVCAAGCWVMVGPDVVQTYLDVLHHCDMRLLARIQPWEKVGLEPTELDEGDALLDWRHTLPGQPERAGLRYVHRFSLEELARLAENSFASALLPQAEREAYLGLFRGQAQALGLL